VKSVNTRDVHVEGFKRRCTFRYSLCSPGLKTCPTLHSAHTQ
jgi:hypothetical protein